MRNGITRFLFILVLGGFLITSPGCGTGTGTLISGGNAAPPAPPADIPAALQIPTGDQLAIGVDKVASGSNSGTVSLTLKDATASGPFAKEFAGTADNVKFIEDALNGLLSPYSQLIIPVGTNIHHFKGVSLVQDVGDVVFDEMDIDFSDFDFDGDGRTESCSGNTTIATDAGGIVHPICMRVWANGKPAMAAVFTEYPTPTNPGAGRMMGINVSNGVILFPEGAFLGMNYDEHDPSVGRSVELLTREEDPAGFRVHMALDQQGPEATSIKTVKMSLTGGHEIGTDKIQGVVRFKEDDHFLSGSLHFDPSRPAAPDVTDQCVDLLTGDAPDPSNTSDNAQCVNLGIDVGGIPFLDFPDATEVFIPADFPDTPPRI